MKKLMAAMLCGLMIIGAGCIFDNDEEDYDGMDGNAGFVAKEVADMGRMSLAGMETGLAVGAGKAAADDVTEANITWDTLNGSWVRSADVTYPDGNAKRYDTLTFTDNNGNTTLQPATVVIGKIDHAHRSELTTNGGTDFKFVGDMVVDLTHDGTDYTTATKNGTGNFSMSDVNLSSSEVDDVVYLKTGGVWQYPSSGTVDITRPLRLIHIEFIGNNQARATVTNRFNSNQSHTFLISLETGQEYEE